MLVLDVIGVESDGMPLAAGVPVNPRKTLSAPVGADFTVRCPVVTPQGSTLPLSTGIALLFTIKKKFTDFQPLVSRSATAMSGTGHFRFVPTDTKDLAPGAYVYDIWRTDSAGVRTAVVPTSPFLLEPAATVLGQVGNVPP